MSSLSILCNAAVTAGVVSGVIALILGILLGTIIYKIVANKKIGRSKTNAVKIIEEAYAEAKSIKKESIIEAKEEAQKIRDEANEEAKERRAEIQKQEERLDQREEYVTKKETSLDTKQEQLENEKTILEKNKLILDEKISEQEEIKIQMLEKLEKISGLTKNQAKDLLIENITDEAKKDAGVLIKKIEDEAKEKGDKLAQDIVMSAIQRCATDLSSEMTVSTVALPNDEMKGRIIGREGRNIRSIESATGVELIVDDTPETITVSSFDPIRREIARLSLEKLIIDAEKQLLSKSSRVKALQAEHAAAEKEYERKAELYEKARLSAEREIIERGADAIRRGLKAGDVCPVCGEVLKSDPVQSEHNHDDAKSQADAMSKEAENARSVSERLSRDLSAAVTEEKSAKERLDEYKSALASLPAADKIAAEKAVALQEVELKKRAAEGKNGKTEYQRKSISAFKKGTGNDGADHRMEVVSGSCCQSISTCIGRLPWIK